MRFQREGIGLNVKPINLPQDTSGPGTGGLRLLSNAPHPNARKIFVNWLLSHEGRAGLVDAAGNEQPAAGRARGRPGAGADPARLGEYLNLNKEENMPIWIRSDEIVRATLK